MKPVAEFVPTKTGTMPDHGPDHGLQNLGMNVRRSGKEKLAE